MRAAAAVVALAATVVLVGCQDPYVGAGHTQPAGPARATPPIGEVPTAATATRRFALRWINWDWRGAANGQRSLARLAVGSLATQLAENAEAVRADATLARDKPASRGQVVAIALRGEGATRTGVVVTREQTYSAGHPDLGGAHYRVYLVRVVRAGRGWGVIRWAPQQ
jgi:hypothetical protein